MAQQWFRVEIDSGQAPEPLLDSQIVFHGVNKSGSLCMANVLRESYLQHGRMDQFLSLYHNPATNLEEYRESVNSSSGHAFFVGHYLYGAVDAPKKDRVIVSQFRHPVPRMISCFQWLKNKHEKRHGDASGFPDLEKFIRKGKGKAHSQLKQFGAGFGPNSTELGKLSCQDLLERSQANIEQDVLLVGIAEEFEETLFMLAHMCGLPAVSPWRQDTRNKGRPLVSELPTSITDLIADVYQHDVVLYQWAKRRFDAAVAAADIGGDLEAYKLACATQYKERVGDEAWQAIAL